MITLTTPFQINSLLGGSAMVSYNKIVLTPVTCDAVLGIISGPVRLMSTTAPDAAELTGRFSANGITGIMDINVPQVGQKRVILSAGQKTSVMNIITSDQNAVEAGLISLGVIAGTQSTGV